MDTRLDDTTIESTLINSSNTHVKNYTEDLKIVTDDNVRYDDDDDLNVTVYVTFFAYVYILNIVFIFNVLCEYIYIYLENQI